MERTWWSLCLVVCVFTRPRITKVRVICGSTKIEIFLIQVCGSVSDNLNLDKSHAFCL